MECHGRNAGALIIIRERPASDQALVTWEASMAEAQGVPIDTFIDMPPLPVPVATGTVTVAVSPAEPVPWAGL
jgi:hypothetical protein